MLRNRASDRSVSKTRGEQQHLFGGARIKLLDLLLAQAEALVDLSSNSIETIRAGVLAGVGIGFFTKASLADELAGPDIMTVLAEFVRTVRDVSLVWPKRRFVPARVRHTTEFFAQALSKRLSDGDDVDPTLESRRIHMRPLHIR